jgi:magnesium transporter
VVAVGGERPSDDMTAVYSFTRDDLPLRSGSSAIIASVFDQSPLLGLVLGVSMVLNLVTAGFFGTVIPLALGRIGKDLATSATIFITTATDVLGFFIFLGSAQAVL